MFFQDLDQLPLGHYGAIVLANVLHHVPLAERNPLLQRIQPLLMPGGKLFVFEHNPWNPVTRRVVACCPFDDQAILLYPREIRQRLTAAHFVDLRTDFIVFFPKPLAIFRPFEPMLGWLPLGAQCCVVGARAA